MIGEIPNCNTSTKRSSNLAPFDKISKSGDSGCSGDTFLILVERVYILYCFFTLMKEEI